MSAQGIQFVEIGARFQELQAVFGMSKGLIEEVGTLPAFMQGSEAPSKMQSATEASISWTAANLYALRCAQLGRRCGDATDHPVFRLNMQYGEKDDIKGDSKIRAMGINALVELEGQAQRLTAVHEVANGMQIPLSNQMMVLREFARAFKLIPMVLPSEAEIEKIKAQEQQQGPSDRKS